MSVTINKIEIGLKQFLDSKNYSKTMVLMDKNTAKHCYPLIKSQLPAHKTIIISAGEKHKNIDTCTLIWADMTAHNMDRHSLLINLGGGVIGDMGGFCASTYKRGIDFIQVPTTLLSQVDASVGGKLGIDFNGLKNHIGVFTLPKTVLIDKTFLNTLSIAELRSGFAEVIKHCLIRDAKMWQTIKVLDLDQQDFEALIKHSVAIKEEIVNIDPTEKGLRKILNFGHTLGHAVETHFLENKPKKLLHGEAIAAGMIMEAYLAFKKGMIAEQILIEIEEFIFAIYGKIKLEKSDFENIVKLSLQDKKNKGNQVLAALIDGIGSCKYDIPLSKADMKRALGYYLG